MCQAADYQQVVRRQVRLEFEEFSSRHITVAPPYQRDIGWIFPSYSQARFGIMLRHRFLESCGDLPCEGCNSIVSFNFYLIIVSSVQNFELRLF